MNIVHPIENLSLSPRFVEPEAFQVIRKAATRCLEFSTGMEPGEMRQLYRQPFNIIYVQPSVLKTLKDYEMAFKPADDVLREIMKFYKSNSECAISERLRFEKIPSIATSYYTVILSEEDEIDYPLYTRHPTTGDVTKHEHPYHTLPPFTLPAHPVFMAESAYDVVLHSDKPSGLVYDLYHFSRRCLKREFQTYIHPPLSSACPELVHSSTSTRDSPSSSCSSLKRKREEEASDLDIASWVNDVKVEGLGALPSDDLGTYAFEQAKPYEEAITEQDTWIATAQRRQARKRQRASEMAGK